MAKKKVEDKNSHNGEYIKNDGESSSNEEEPNFSDPEGYVDDISNEDLLGDLLRDKPKETDGVESVIVVDGVPQVGPDRIEKLKSVINKIFGKFGNIINEYYPLNENSHTKGYIFLEYASPLHAIEAVKITNNYKLDKLHTFLVNLFTDFSKYEKIPEKWEPPQPQAYKGQTDLHYYLLEPDAYDQFCVVKAPGQGQSVQIWQNTQPDPTLLEDRQTWTHTYVKWSPLGTYLSTFHKQGIALWGGPNFTQYKKFSHSLVQLIDFSPCEKYLVTYSPLIEINNPDQMRIIIWDIRTGQEKRSFNPDAPSAWPIFRWSHDDKFFARMGTDILSIYETPSFGLLDKKSLKISGIRDFSWSPTDNVIAYWVAEDKDVPAKVTLLDIPNKAETRNKNLFNVADCKIHWQKSGDYLCVKVDRYSKVRKEKNETKYSGMYFNFEIFHMRERQIPVDSVECKEPIQAFAWEPVGTKFAFIHGESPNISYVVLAGLGANGGGSLEFVDTNEFLVMNTTDHFMMSDVEWDPTGRYIVTGVSVWKTQVDTGYWIWSFQGKILKRINLDRFAQLLWRPRPPTLLSEEQQKEIKIKLKKYYPQFESKDRMRQSKASKELIEKRAALMDKFNAYRQKKIAEYNKCKPRRLELRNSTYLIL
ncbi:eukaryotic translation initiation factor 3 eif3 -related [Holotrichia oblita]|uniref:Eukaryotic translation initiation factor 3 eif3 -related n=1 Tax=Holotrichia oblita TaxID=644536 RepID=A0ACB9SNN8_HOLOL|nr:eukaryotic translation initiation factor 3 eif3 -related [Holotrichia oblita]